MKAVVIGLDGCCWNFLEEWIAQGHLPNIKRIRDNGAWSDMESCLPPVTSPNWKCYSTGLNPGKLGVFWWDKVDFKNRKIIFPSSHSYDGKEIWDYLGSAGRKVCVLNMPSTYPPKPVNGILVSGPPDGTETGFTYPPKLEQELKKKYDYSVCSKYIHLIESDPEKVVKELQRLINLRFQVAKDLYLKHEPDFLNVSIFYNNVLQHFFGRSDAVLDTWKMIDKNIADLMKAIPDATYFFMSDHGTNDIKWKFNISTWLEQEGYLILRKNHSGNAVLRLGLTRERIGSLLERLGIKDLVKKFTSAALRQWLPSRDGVVGSMARGHVIDWEKTLVIPSGQGPVYVNPNLPANKILRIVVELKEKFMNLTTPDGTRIARNVFEREEIYSGKYLQDAPHLIIDQADGIHITPSVGFESAFDKFDRWYSENHKIGMFMAYGEHIRAGEIEGPVRITDIAPTVLSLYGGAVPEYMDGKVLKEIFVPASPYFHQEIRHEVPTSVAVGESGSDQESSGTDELMSKLRDLGYL